MPARLAVWGTAAILIGCATTTEPPPRAAAQAIDLDYRLAALPWGEGGHMLFLAKAVEEDGELKLCGAYGLANVRKPAKGSSRAAANRRFCGLVRFRWRRGWASWRRTTVRARLWASPPAAL